MTTAWCPMETTSVAAFLGGSSARLDAATAALEEAAAELAAIDSATQWQCAAMDALRTGVDELHERVTRILGAADSARQAIARMPATVSSVWQVPCG